MATPRAKKGDGDGERRPSPNSVPAQPQGAKSKGLGRCLAQDAWGTVVTTTFVPCDGTVGERAGVFGGSVRQSAPGVAEITLLNWRGAPHGTWQIPEGSPIPPEVYDLFRTGPVSPAAAPANMASDGSAAGARRTRPKPGAPKA